MSAVEVVRVVVEERRRQSLWHAIADEAGTPGQHGWAQQVCRLCVSELAGVDAAALTLRATGRAQDLLGASDEWAGRLDEQQYTLGEGPGVQAFEDGSPILVDDLSRHEERWPGFADTAHAVGAAAVFAFALRIGAIQLGTMTFYRRRAGGLAARAVADATVLVDLITLALVEQAEHAERAGVDWIRDTGSYQDVNVATGILAARLAISLDEAFLRLRAHAFRLGRPILDLAGDILADRIDVDELNE